jgi:hypothetical protein
MSLKDNLDWGEKAVAEVRRYVQYSTNNLKADLVASLLPRMEFDKLRNLEAAKAAKQASIVGDQASVAQKVAFFNQQATLSPQPQVRPVPKRLDVYKFRNEVQDRMALVRVGDPSVAADATGNAGRSLSKYAQNFFVSEGHANDTHTYLMSIAWAAKQAGAGNCMEQAAIAFLYLEEQGVGPLDYMRFSAPAYDHAWMVIGRVDGSNTFDLSSWGEDAVWCDPWQLREGRVYSIQDLILSKATNLDSNFKLDSAKLVQGGLPVSEWRTA